MPVETVVILAGGSGTRLWPASTATKPKQFLAVDGELSLLCRTVERAAAGGCDGEIIIVTHRDQVPAVLDDLRAVPAVADRVVVLAEPAARNTGPALALAAAYVQATRGPSARLLVLSSDHLVRTNEQFVADVETAATLAADGYLVTFGVTPSRAETGYGYLETAGPLGGGFAVAAFKEKPDVATAQQYCADGRYLWNAGIFVFRADSFLNELATSAPQVHVAFADLLQRGTAALLPVAQAPAGGGVFGRPAVVFAPPAATYAAVPAVSVDYAVFEHSDRVAVVRAGFLWSDVGSWDQIAEIATQPPAAATLVVESSGVYVDSDLPVAVCGVNDVIVVIKNGMALVCAKGKSQLVKQAAAYFAAPPA